MMHSDYGPEMETGFVRLENKAAQPERLRLFYRRMGAEGPVVVLLHGWPQTSHAWRGVMPLLAASGYTAVAPDLRGCGASDKPTGGYDAATRMEDVRALLAALELDEQAVFVVGHGEGVSLAQAFAVAYPEEVAAIAVLSALPVTVHAGRGSRDWLTGFHQTPDLPEALLGAQVETYLRHFFQSWSHDPHQIAEEEIAVYAQALSTPGALRAGLAPFRTAAEDNAYFRRHTGAITAPALLLIGESDSRTPAETIQAEWRQVAPDLQTITISKGGYWLPEERPDPVAAALLTFFREVQG